MSTSAINGRYDDEIPCEEPAAVWPLLLAAGSAMMLGYFAGRISFAKEAREAIRRVEESPEPIEVFVRAL